MSKTKKIVGKEETVFHPRVQGLDRCFDSLGINVESVPDEIKRQFGECFMYLPTFGITDEAVGIDSIIYKDLVKNRTPHLVVSLMLNGQHYTKKHCVLVNGDPKLRGRPVPEEYHKYTFTASRGRAELMRVKNGKEVLGEYTFVP